MGNIAHYLEFKEKNTDKIATLATQIGEITEEAHWDLIEGMKGVLGAAAANESTDDESDQDEALSTAETWVTNNCSDGGIAEDVAMALWLRGAKDGEAHLGKVAMTKTPDVETPLPGAAYLASPGWGHIFVGKREEITRWIYDCEKKELVAAQVLNANAWVDLDRASMADLLESIHDNDANEKPDEFDLVAFDSLPSWEKIEHSEEQAVQPQETIAERQPG